MSRFLINPFCESEPVWGSEISQGFKASRARDFHRLIPEYRSTPLISLPALARQLGIGGLFVKDESQRFGLKAFKVLGASYAIYKFLQNQWGSAEPMLTDFNHFIEVCNRNRGNFTFCTATDGNHGRAVAWSARKFLQKAVIYMPAGTAAARIHNIKNEGATVNIVDGSYDDAVRQAALEAGKHNWTVISDTAYLGYTKIPGLIMAGYLTMFEEMEESINVPGGPEVDLVILQGGVGSFAAAAVWYYCHRYGKRRPRLICVEPEEAACLYTSAASPGGKLSSSTGNFKTMMAGLNCGTPSLLAWPVLRHGIDAFMTISDKHAAEAMRRFYRPGGNDGQIISGESGAAGLGALIALLSDLKKVKMEKRLDLTPTSRVLIINTEGDTDPSNFKKIIYS